MFHSHSSGLLSIRQVTLRVHCVCARRDHAAFTDLCCVLLHLSVPLHLVVPLPDLRHTHLQLHVCPDGHFQRRTHHCPLPLPVPVLSGVHPPRGQLDQVRRRSRAETHEVGAAPPAAQHTQLHTLNTLLLLLILLLLLLKLNTSSVVDPTIQWPFSLPVAIFYPLSPVAVWLHRLPECPWTRADGSICWFLT